MVVVRLRRRPCTNMVIKNRYKVIKQRKAKENKKQKKKE